MRPEHIEANKLVDLAYTEDREAYKAALIDLSKRYPPALYDTIKRNAARQYRSETKDHRFTGWRADWINEGRGGSDAADTERAGGETG
ncbi:hypothetical protein [Marinobacter sp.]|uniref:hypothetical protein n=1 Tax=Marinobacter sp. TaxID=50741 RepID=UPI0035C6C4D8